MIVRRSKRRPLAKNEQLFDLSIYSNYEKCTSSNVDSYICSFSVEDVNAMMH